MGAVGVEVGAGAEASGMTKEVDRVDDELSQSETRVL